MQAFSSKNYVLPFICATCLIWPLIISVAGFKTEEIKVNSTYKKVRHWREMHEKYEFEQYLQDFHVTIPLDELESRRRVFQEHLRNISTFNKQHQKWKMGATPFLHMSRNEFLRFVGGVAPELVSITRPGPHHQGIHESKAEISTLPKSLDWRMQNVISPVKDQGTMCGSCWAFATIEAIETALAIQTGRRYLLSVQQVTSCTQVPELYPSGCEGGHVYYALESIIYNQNTVSEFRDPYVSMDGINRPCHDGNDTPLSSFVVKGYKTIPRGSYDDVMEALTTIGQLLVFVDPEGWNLYDTGIFTSCERSSNVTHFTQLVGYGEDVLDATPFWIIRNSWGTLWGEAGYIRLLRSVKGYDMLSDCDVLYEAIYPIIHPRTPDFMNSTQVES